MTAFALKFDRKSIAIAADTIAYVPDQTQAKPVGFVDKVAAFPHLRAALFGRGQIKIAGGATAWLAMSPELFSVEDAAERLPEILASVSDRYCDEQGLGSVDSRHFMDSAFWRNAIQDCFCGGGFGRDGSIGVERCRLGSDVGFDHRSP